MRNLPRRLRFLLRAAPVLLIAVAVPAYATPVSYMLSGLFSGSLDGVSFSNTQGVFTLNGSDTSQVTTPDNAFSSTPSVKGHFSLDRRPRF